MMTTTDFRTQCIEFAATYPGPSVREAMAYAQAGTITWEQVYNLFKRSLVSAVAEVA